MHPDCILQLQFREIVSKLGPFGWLMGQTPISGGGGGSSALGRPSQNVIKELTPGSHSFSPYFDNRGNLSKHVK